jgi:hypothetical protein
MTLWVPREFGLTSMSLNGITMDAPPGPVTILCATPDCAHADLTLRQDKESRATLLLLQSRAWTFPGRPANTTPSQAGDRQISVLRIRTP